MSADDIRAGGAYVEVYTEDDGLQEGMVEATGAMQRWADEMQALGERMASAGKGMMMLGAAMGAPLIASVQIGSAADDMNDKFDRVFRNMADSTRAWADDYASSMGRSRTEIIRLLSGLQGVIAPMGFARGEAAEMSKAAMQLGIDLAALNAANPSDVIKDISMAMVGNVRAMRQYGVVINSAALDQQLLAMGFHTAKDGATEQQKVMARLQLMIRNSGDAHGQAARDANDYASVLDRVKGEMNNIAVTVGQILLPTYTQFGRAAARVLGWFDDFIKKNPELVQKWSQMSTGVFAAGAALYGLGQASQAVSWLLSPGGLLAAGAAAALYMSGAFDTAAQSWVDFIGKIEVGGKTVAEWWDQLGSVIGSGLEMINLCLDEVLTDVDMAMTSWAGNILKGITDFVTEAASVFDPIGTGIISMFEEAAVGVGQVWNQMLLDLSTSINRWISEKIPLRLRQMLGLEAGISLGGLEVNEKSIRSAAQTARAALPGIASGARLAAEGLNQAVGSRLQDRLAESMSHLRDLAGQKSMVSEDMQVAMQPFVDGLTKLMAEFSVVSPDRSKQAKGQEPPMGPRELQERFAVAGTFSALEASQLGRGGMGAKLLAAANRGNDYLKQIEDNTDDMSAEYVQEG